MRKPIHIPVELRARVLAAFRARGLRAAIVRVKFWTTKEELRS